MIKNHYKYPENPYAQLTGDVLENHLSGFLIDHWSVSAVSEFCQNQKSFERKYVFKDRSATRSLSAIISVAYHKALSKYFEGKMNGIKLSPEELLTHGHRALEQVGAEEYRAQVKLTIAQMKDKALASVNFMLLSFLQESDSYNNEIEQILMIEEKITVWVNVNDVPVPLPLVLRPDMVFITKSGELAIMDHKGVKAYTKPGDVAPKHSQQTMGYTIGFRHLDIAGMFPEMAAKYPKILEGVKHFFFFENKMTKNKDESRQIRQIPIDMAEAGPVYEDILFEGVSSMMQAVQNPDHIYTMNPRDFMNSNEELMEFWIKTHLQGLEGWPKLSPRTKRMLSKKKERIRQAAITGIPKSFIKSFTQPKQFVYFNPKEMEDKTPQERIAFRLNAFNYPVNVEHRIEGYSCDTFLITISASQKTSKIHQFRLDIANALGVRNVRILPELIEHKGKTYVAIEAGRKERRWLNSADMEKTNGPVFVLGKTNFGKTISWSPANSSTPHMLISGAAGAGKSSVIKSLIEQALEKGINIYLLDPKHEFGEYRERGIEVLNEIAEIEEFMRGKVAEMDQIFREHGAKGNGQKQLIIFDESADCFARQSKEPDFEDLGFEDSDLTKKEIDENKRIARNKFLTLQDNTLILAQKARSAGIHLILAAQRFSVKVLTGDAKANFPARLCLTTASVVDSKVMLDQEGAENLEGKGDALYTSPEHPTPIRIQCFSGDPLK